MHRRGDLILSLGLAAVTSASPSATQGASQKVPMARHRAPLGAGDGRRGATRICKASGATRRPSRWSVPRASRDASRSPKRKWPRSERVEKEQAAQRLAGAEGAAVGRTVGGPIRRSGATSTTASGRTTAVLGKCLRQTSLDGGSKGRYESRMGHAGREEGRGPRGPRATASGRTESYLDPDTGERCLHDGVTALMWQGPNNGGHNRIVQSPGYVTILHEEYLDRRIIPTDGRAHGEHLAVVRRCGWASGRATRSSSTRPDFINRTNYELGQHLHATV